MDNLKFGLKVLAIFLVAFFGIIASAGALNYGHGIYSLAGALNFIIVGWADFCLYKLLFGKKDNE